MKKFFNLMTLCVLIASPEVHAATTIASFDFSTTTSDSTDTEPNSVATPFSYIFETPGNTGRNTGGRAFIRARATGSILGDALADGDYAQFTVIADSGFALDLETLSFDFGGFRTGDDSNNFTSNIVVMSSVDGFASSLFTDSHFVNTASGGGTFKTGNSIDLSGAAFQGLSSVTFRFAFFDDFTSTESTASVNLFDNVTLNGSLSVPEPSRFALVGIAVSAIWLRRRRRSPIGPKPVASQRIC